MLCLFWQLLSRRRGLFCLLRSNKRERGRKCLVWKMRDWFTDSWWAEEEEYERMLFVVPAVLLPPDGYRGRKKMRLLFHPFAFVEFCTKYSELHPTEPSWPEGDGYPRNYDKRARESGDEERVKTFGGERKKRRQKRENRAREQDERPPESYPRCLSSPLSQWGH